MHRLVYVSVNVGWVNVTPRPNLQSLPDKTTTEKRCVTLAGVSKYGNASSPMYVCVRVGVGKKAKGALHHAGVLVMLRSGLTLCMHTLYAGKEKLLSATLRASELNAVGLEAPGVHQWLFFSTHNRCCIFYVTPNSKKIPRIDSESTYNKV